MQDKTEEQWRKLCEQAAVEQDPAKLHELISEINRLLEERSRSIVQGMRKNPEF